MTREELVQHCIDAVARQRPSATAEKAVINGQTAGDYGDAAILHEHVVAADDDVNTHASAQNSDVAALNDTAQGIKRHKGKMLFLRLRSSASNSYVAKRPLMTITCCRSRTCHIEGTERGLSNKPVSHNLPVSLNNKMQQRT